MFDKSIRSILSAKKLFVKQIFSRLSVQFATLLTGVAGAITLLFCVVYFLLHVDSEREFVKYSLQQKTDAFAVNLAQLMTQGDFSLYQTILFAKVSENGVTAVVVRSISGSERKLTEYARGMIKGDNGDIFDYWQAGPEESGLRKRAFMVAQSDIVFGNDLLGRVSVYYSNQPFWEKFYAFIKSVLVLITASSAILVFVIIVGFRIMVSKPIERIAEVAREGSLGNLSVKAEVHSHNEIGALAKALNFMILRLKKLLDSQREYSESLQETVKSQARELVRAETMASLGDLVAGVSHEINTPIGICITAISHQKKAIEEVDKSFEAGTLTRSEMSEFITASREGFSIININLQKAARLVQSFKNVAADRSTHERRQFLLKDYIEEVLVSLKPKFRKTSYQIKLECEDIVMESYPGAISQIITNLVMNSLMHAFEAQERGTITITAEMLMDEVHLVIRDDGRGIPAQLLERIFDPFFTTKRNKGGTGLGLHIAYNLVTQLLKGRISCSSSIGKWTEFTVILPPVTPRSD